MTDPATLDPSALEQILEDTGGDPEFLAELIDDYLGNTRTLIADLANSCVLGDADQARRIAHTIKGTSASMGALALSALAADIEMQCQAGNIQAVGGRVPELQDAFHLADAWLVMQRSSDETRS